ncbi:MAG: hypothetical protein LBI18_10420 [Planctomycetaceae bacterium]|nr:hypothetical protein [Planctomycetaceae bacterium]
MSLCFGFVIAFRKRKIAKQVILEFDAIIIKYYVWSKRLKYESITKIYHQCDLPLDKPPYPEGLLILLDWNGKIIGRIPMTMTDFEILETELLRRIQNATGKQVYRREEELIEKRRNKKKIRQELTISAGLMFLGLCCMSILLIRDHWNYSKERSRYGSIEATMKQHPFFDNTDKNIHRLEYSFTVDEKEYTNTRTFNETEWANLKGKETITVYYIPNNPHDNFLERDIHYSVTIANLTFRWVSLGFYFVTMCIVFFRVLGYNFKTYNGITYLLKPDQILEDRLDELAKHSNKPFSS